MRTGAPLLVRAKATLLATGGGPTMYKYHTPSGDKSCDGLAMALRAGLPLRDMEMVQFHPTGLLAGPGTRMTGTVLEEGLRGAGGYLLDGRAERFMFAYDERGERATRDVVSRSIQDRIRQGFATPNGGVWIEMGHLGPDNVRRGFKGMVERCADCGFDLAAGRVEVVPTAHYMMGGVVFGADCATPMQRLFAAGEDTGGVHGANRLGGNGVANSTVFGGLAGDAMAPFVRAHGAHADPDPAAIEAGLDHARGALPPAPRRPQCHPRAPLRRDVGGCRHPAHRRRPAARRSQRSTTSIAPSTRPASPTATAPIISPGTTGSTSRTWCWSRAAIAAAALAREDSRGAHFREDFPETSDLATSRYTVARLAEGGARDHDRAGAFHARRARRDAAARGRRVTAALGLLSLKLLGILWLGAFLGALAVGGAGFAFALVASSVWLHALPPLQTAVLVLASGVCLHLFSIWLMRRTLEPGRLWPFLAGGALGIPIGISLLTRSDPGVLKTSLGFFLLAYGLFALMAPRLPHVSRGGRLADGLVGFIGGILGGLGGFSGVLPTIWAQLRGWSKETIRGVCQPFIFLAQLTSLALLGGIAIDRASLVMFAAIVPALLAGSWVGWLIYGRLDERRFRQVLAGLLALSGLVLVL